MSYRCSGHCFRGASRAERLRKFKSFGKPLILMFLMDWFVAFCFIQVWFAPSSCTSRRPKRVYSTCLKCSEP